jgi:tetratricopeptide (TPR) repeat protein
VGDNDRRAAAAACPSDEALAAWLDARLDAEETERLEAHLAGCPTCLELVGALSPALALPDWRAGARPSFRDDVPNAPAAAVVRPLVRAEASDPAPTPTSEPTPVPSAARRWRPLLVAAALLAVAGGALTVVQFQREPDTSAAIERLSRAQGETRRTHGRLTAFAWAEPPATLRGVTESAPDHAAALATDAADIARVYGADRSASALHATGVAHLMAGDVDAAVSALDAAAAARPLDVRILNDAAVAHLQRASTQADDRSLLRARHLAEEAVRLQPDRADAWFNLAHIARLAGDHALTDRAREQCARLEPGSAWQRELQRW